MERRTKESYEYGVTNMYQLLTYDEEALRKYCKGDDVLYIYYKKLLSRMKEEPVFNKGRFYHPFHRFPKTFRERVLRFNGYRIKEIFDIPGSDLQTLAKVLEDWWDKNELYYTNCQLRKFQEEVQSDLRLKFGKNKNAFFIRKNNFKRTFQI